MFENATILTREFLMGEGGKNVEHLLPAKQSALFREYYVNVCALIQKCHYLEPSIEQIEEYIQTGSFRYDADNVISCPLGSPSMRTYLFLSAQAKQLIYDLLSGRGSMLRGEDRKADVCRDTLDRIKQLGLFQRTPTTV